MRAAAISIVEELNQAGFIAYFAGGCVRDALLGREPKDYDIATDATPDQILKIFPGGDSIGAHFGVILIRRKGFHFEIATFRKDGEYRDGRRPDSVQFTDAETDATRRDFTVNGLFEDPIKDRVIDFVGGEEDLKNNHLRAIGEAHERFAEDYLRLLRAVRFTTVLGFKIEPSTWQAIQQEAVNIDQIAPERIREELDKVWKHPNRVAGFDLLHDSGLMQVILPELIKLKDGDGFTRIRAMLELLPENATLPLVLSVLFHESGAETTTDILKRLKHPNQLIDDTVTAVANHAEFNTVEKMRIANLKRLMARYTFSDELELHRTYCVSTNGQMGSYEFLKAKQEEYAGQPIIPKPFLTGNDLINLGVKPGPEMGEILTEAQDLQLESQHTDREQAMHWLKERINT